MTIFLLGTQGAEGGSQGGILGLVIPMVLMFGLIYFLMIRPQKKREKETKNMLEELKVGDNVTSIGGICGKVIRMREDIITVEVGSSKLEMVFEKWAIKTVDKPIAAD